MREADGSEREGGWTWQREARDNEVEGRGERSIF